MLDSGGVGSEPRLRIRGDGVRMTTALADELDAASGGGGAGASFVAEDYTEIEWVRTYAAMAADSAVSVEVVSDASGPVATGQEEPVTVRLTIVKAVADVEHVVRLWLLYSSLSDCMHVHACGCLQIVSSMPVAFHALPRCFQCFCMRVGDPVRALGTLRCIVLTEHTIGRCACRFGTLMGLQIDTGDGGALKGDPPVRLRHGTYQKTTCSGLPPESALVKRGIWTCFWTCLSP